MKKALFLFTGLILLTSGCSTDDSSAIKANLFINNELEFIPDRNTKTEENAATIEDFDTAQGNKFRVFQFIENSQNASEKRSLIFRVNIPNDNRVTYLYTFFQPLEDREIEGYFEWGGIRYNLYSGRIGITNRGNNKFIIDFDIRGKTLEGEIVYISGRIEGKLGNLTL